MFLEFSVENYRSIADRQTLTFVAAKQKSDAEGVPAVEVEGFSAGKVLTSAVLYGANASGKSNVLRALAEMTAMIAVFGQVGALSVDPFRLDAEWRAKPTTFSLSFLIEGVRYEYGFSVKAKIVEDEWLVAYPKRTPQLWYERKKTESAIHFGSNLRGEKSRIEKMTRPDALFLGVAAQFNHPQLTGIYQWLIQNVRVQRAAGFGPLHTIRFVHENENMPALVARLLQGADLGISGIKLRRHAKKADITSDARFIIRTDADDEFFEVLTEHRCSDGTSVLFDLLDNESDGTIRYFELIEPITRALASGGLLAIDELDQSLHPALVRQLVRLFHDPATNPKHAQLLFNTHDTTLLDHDVFRRDQIWFVEKDDAGKSRLYSLLEYSPRKNEALARGYLAGRYGAVPFLGDLKFKEISAAKASGRAEP